MSNIKTKESKCICAFCNKEIDDLDSKVTYDNEDYHEYCLEEKLLEEDF